MKTVTVALVLAFLYQGVSVHIYKAQTIYRVEYSEVC